MRRVLIVEDEPKIVEGLRWYFEREGFEVLEAADGLIGLEKARTENPTLIVLDLMLPGLDGLDVCREIRRKCETPILMLTARSDELDKIVGLELGADDYITKPFSPRELMARVKAVLRRSAARPEPGAERLEFGPLVIDRDRHEVKISDRPVPLTAREFALLFQLAARPGRVYSRQELLDRLWKEDEFVEERIVDVHIRHIREKLGPRDSEGGPWIGTVWGVGYRFEPL